MRLDSISFFLILIVLIGYRFRLRYCYLVSIVLSIFLLQRNHSTPLYTRFTTLFIFNVLPLITFGFRRKSFEYKEKIRLNLEEVRNSYERLLSEDKVQIQTNLDFERRIEQISSLYEISKQMSEGLSFERIFGVLGNNLKAPFKFKTVALLIIKKESDEICDAYKIVQQNRIERFKPEEFDIEILNIVKTVKGPILISGRQDEIYSKLSILKRFETLVLVPLSIEGKVLAILYIENLPANYFDNFLILASQFAIQLERVFLYNRVEEMAITDSLTGVHTRRHIMARFVEEIRRSMRHKSPLSILILDIDHFKDKNDKFGHLVGDVVLREIGGLLESRVREIDIIGRYGGEEFMIVLSDTHKKDASVVAERIRETIETTKFKAYDEVVDVTVSLGVASFPEDGVDLEGLIECADRALYRAKEAGRNRVVVYNE